MRQATLRNCPFDALAKDYRPVVCSVNRALIDRLIAGLGIDDITTAEQQRGGHCSVVLTWRTDVASESSLSANPWRAPIRDACNLLVF